MDLRLAPTTMPVSVRPTLAPRLTSGSPAVPEAGFTGALKSALHAVSAAQNQSTQLQHEVQMENPTVSLEETMVAIQKAHRLPGHFARAQPHGASLYRHHEHAGLSGRASFSCAPGPDGVTSPP
jgi:flagellar hook-basal body complex protein FliE